MVLSSSLKAALTGVVASPILWDEPLAGWTTFRIGGPADALVTLLEVKELQEVLSFCHRERVPWKILGKGSNILAPDDGFRGVVIVLGSGFKYIDSQQTAESKHMIVRVGPAVTLPRLAEWCAANGLSGIEFASGIPGTVGGAVFMNAGAWGSEMADVISCIEIVDKEKVETIERDQLVFGYRCCESLAGRKEMSVLSSVELRLVKRDEAKIRETMHSLLEARRDRQPLGLPNAGSIFKNPAGESAGSLIEQAGLKGVRIGDVEVSEKHANFFVNRGTGTARDVIALRDKVCARVRSHSGINLETELEIMESPA